MLEDFGDTPISHNYAYHINISGADNASGSIHIDWDYFFEGHPNYNVYNNYLPVKGPYKSNGLE